MLRTVVRGAAAAAGLLCVCALLALGIGPRIFGYRTLTVLTGSMRPAAPVGSMVVATEKPVRDLHVGDILVYQAPIEDRRVVSHRVVSMSSPAEGVYVVQTKGDANAAPDPWQAQITDTTVWTVRTVVPGVGSAVRMLRSRAVHVGLIYGIPLLLALMWLSDIWRPRGPAEASAVHA